MEGADPLGWVGATLESKYRIDALIGEGGFGFVYRGVHLRLSKPVAVKFLRPDVAGTGKDREKFQRRFEAEGRLLYDLSRATIGVVQAHDLGIATSPRGDSTPFIVMEWLEGWTLTDELRSRPSRSVGEAIELLMPVLDALVVAHEMGIVHRDLKPSNLMLCRVGARTLIKVLDFGIAQVVGMEGAGGVTTAHGIFTDAYAAPEQFDPSLGATGPWTDVYAFGLILLEVVDGRRRYSNDFVKARDEALNLESRPSLRADRSLDVVMRRALAVDPRNRPRSASELKDLLTKKPEQVVDHPGTLVAEPAPTLHRPKKKSRGWLIVLFTLVVVLGAGGVGGYWWLNLRACGKDVDCAGDLVCQAGQCIAPPSIAVTTDGALETPENMALIAEGQYFIGSSAKDATPCERPRRSVYLLPFWIDKTEVTMSEYKQCIGCVSTEQHAKDQGTLWSEHLCNIRRAQRGERVDDDPVNCVDQKQAAFYCASVGKRLPTDEEWEAAARGTKGNEYPWGDTAPSCDKAVFGRLEGVNGVDAAGRNCWGMGTSRVGSMWVSPLGVADLAGNVWEWTSTSCATVGNEPLDRAGAEQARRTARPQSGNATLRGGGFEWSPEHLRSWKRLSWPTKNAGVSTGFRCAKDEH